MKLPSDNPKNFIMQLRETLSASMPQREKDCQTWDSLFYAGATVGDHNPAIANIITSRIRTQAGNLFSPDNLTYRLEYDATVSDEHTLDLGSAAASYVSRELRDADADLEFGDGVELALRHGSAFGQLDWNGRALATDIIPQACFGVLNERAKGLYEQGQDAIMVRYATPIESFRAWLTKFKRTENIREAFDQESKDGQVRWADMNEGTRVVLGLNQPIGSSSSINDAGFVNLLPRMPYIPNASMAGRQVQIDAIWLHDTEREEWATVYVIDGNDTIGTDIWRNFLGVKGRHPYFQICPHPVKGYIFGRSSIADIAEQQNFIRKHSAGMDYILSMQEDPARVGFGATNTAEIYKQALRSPGGWVQESGPNAKVQSFAPEMPQNLIPALELVGSYASDAANQPPVVQGRGDQGVRAGGHAETLMTAASARERRAATRTVRQCGDMGHLAMEILKVKSAEELGDKAGKTFLLENVPEGYHVLCNGYTASPLFAAEHRAILNDLLKAGAIGPEEYLDGLNPQGHDMLRTALRRREEQQAKIIQSLPPEERVKLFTHSGRRR